MEKILKAIEAAFDAAIAAIKFAAQIFTEPDSANGKPSFGRVTGTYVIIKIVELADAGKVIPEAMMTLFYVLVGYSLMSKLSPPVLDVVKTWMQKGTPKSDTPAQSG